MARIGCTQKRREYQITISQKRQSIQLYIMRNIRVSFHHSHFIYKFKIDLHVRDNTNMFSIDIRKINETYNAIINLLILTPEQKIVFDGLSIAFKSQFIRQFQQVFKVRKKVDFVGQHAHQQVQYFQTKFQTQDNFVYKCKELYILIMRQGNQITNFKAMLNKPYFYRLFYQFASAYQKSAQENKTNSYILYSCLINTVLNIINMQKVATEEKDEIIEYVNKFTLLGWEKNLNNYDYTNLTALFEKCEEIWIKCLHNNKNHGWLYKKHENEQINSSVLRTLIQSIKPENKNLKIQSQIVRFLCEALERCQGVNQLLLFITECINLRISMRLGQLAQSLNLFKFFHQNSIYLTLPPDLTEEMGKKIIRLKQKISNQQNWKSQVNICKQKVKYLIERFTKFKSGKIESKKQKEGIFKTQRQRIRKQSFIMTNFQEVRHRFQDAILHEDHHSKSLKLLNQNLELLEISKRFQEKIKAKQKIIRELQLTISEFVDVKKKYVRQNILKVQKKVYDIQVDCLKQKNSTKNAQMDRSQAKTPERNSIDKSKNNVASNLPLPPPPPSMSSFLNSQNTTSPSISHNLPLPLPPPPPPPPPFASHSGGKSLRGSRNSKQVHKLPPPPPPPPSDLQLPPPPPPPLPPFSLTPPPLLTSFNKRNQGERKQIKMINWSTVEISKVKDSFWESVEDVQFNQEDLISFFAKKEDKALEAPKIVVSFKQKKSLLRPQRAKNIQIILKKTRIYIPKIPFIIEQLNEQMLTLTNVDSLLNVIPTAEEGETYLELKISDPEEWSEADLYFCLIAKIHGYFEILKAIKFKFQFQSISDNFNERINQFQQFFIELQKDSLFQIFLSHLLTVGNFMNNDTSRGNAYGFKLQSLEKSYILVGQDKKTSLFDYIMQMMLKKGVDFKDRNYYKQKKITPIQVLKQDLKELTKECRNVQQVLLLSGQEDTRTPEVFLSFYIDSRQKITAMDIKYHECSKIFSRVSDFYCQKMESQKLIKIVNEFRSRVLRYLQAKKIQIKR